MGRRATILVFLMAVTGCVTSPPGATPPVATSAASDARAPVTILISIDGFRPDYLHRGDTPTLDGLAARGVQAAMRPGFPTLTFPQHTTLVTGKRPDRHGIVANIFYDPRRPDRFYGKEPGATDAFWWSDAEPVWVTAERAGIRTGTMFWPGAEAPHDGIRASDRKPFDRNFTGEQRVQTVLEWLGRPAATRPHFVTLYFDAVDIAGHHDGPVSPATREAVRSVDASIGVLATRLAMSGQPVNFVIVSDHGMRAVQPARITMLDDLLPTSSYRLVSYGPFATIDPVAGYEAAVARVLLRRHPDMRCWRRGDVPARFHYGRNPRVAAFVCLAAAGGEIVTQPVTNKGEHGYDPDDPEMAGLFLASGPAFRRGARVPRRFDNVDLYPMLMRLVGVAPLANDGDARTLAPLLREGPLRQGE